MARHSTPVSGHGSKHGIRLAVHPQYMWLASLAVATTLSFTTRAPAVIPKAALEALGGNVPRMMLGCILLVAYCFLPDLACGAGPSM